MANPFKNAPQAQSVSVGNAIDLFKKMMSMGKNPQQIINIIINNNPQLASVVSEMQQSGLSPIDYAKKVAMQQNININPTIEEMMNLTKNM
ncbi:MAG: hypothetical protein J6R47_00990 [Acholeplasmatales bacterium]|nr:hypothetical protein [Acholeplasmatales bacterium]